MAKKELAKQNWLTRLVPEFIVRALTKMEDNPEAPEHGASWTAGSGIAPVFSARQSMAVYARHAYTNACVTRASQDIANLPIKLLSGAGESTTEIDSHPLLELFNQPSSTVDGYLFREQFMVDLIMTGNCYTLLVGPENKLTSLYRLHPENVRIIPDPVKMISGYEYNDGGSTVVYPPERVVHIRTASWDINANGELYGTGIVEALNEEITADINAQRMSASVSKQGRPDVLLSPTDPADIWDRRRRQEITQAYKAMTEHGGAMALSGQVKVETLNLSPRDLEFSSLRQTVRENVSAVTGVPSTVLGLPDANYATARQANITYWEIQQKRARKLEQALTRIARLVDSDLHVIIDFSEVEALQTVRTEKLERVKMHIENGMSPSQAYSYEGLEDSPFGEIETEQSVSESDSTIEQALSSLFTETKDTQSEIIMRGSVGDVNPTNFPEDGNDKQVALRNSDYERFPWQEALDLKDNWPQIWDRGGNVLGNLQFRRLLPIARRDSSIAQTETEEKAIRLREAWSARHFEDYRLAGVVAQIKWLTVGSRGLSHMRKVISEEKERLSKKSKQARTKVEKDALWHSWNNKSLVPAMRQMTRASEIYLELASNRYARRAEQLKIQLEKQSEEKAINYTEILGRASEIASIKKIIGRAYRTVFFLTGNDQITALYQLAERNQPSDVLFSGDPERDIERLARRIIDTSEKQVKRLVRRGIRDGLSNEQIKELIKSSTTFAETRAQRIAQTETTKAINTATIESYKEFEEKEKVKIYKEWISSRDDKVRDSHSELDSDPPIPVREDFEIDGYSTDAPANFGEASLDINCRCTIAPVIIE